jgi:hypothetical protein
MQQGITLTPEAYCETLNKVHRAVQKKRRGMLVFIVVLLHDKVYWDARRRMEFLHVPEH